MMSSKSISSLESTRLSFFPSIYLLKNQSAANYNFGRKASTALPHIYWVLNLSRQYLNITGFLEITLSHISWVSDWLGTESGRKDKYWQPDTHFLSLIVFRNKMYSRRISISSFITDFLDLPEIGGKF